jgi:hypothetical protein
MSKKKLLEESTIRSFMKLANLQPLTDKFLKEAEEPEEAKDEEEEEEDEEKEGEEEEVVKEAGETRAVTMPAERDPPKDRLTEEDEEDEAKMEEGKESEGRPASKKEAPKGASLAGKAPAKMDAAKNAAGDAKLKPLKAGTHHSDKPDSIETKGHSNAPKKNNSQFEVVSESLEEEMQEADMEAPEAGAEMGSAGESGEHQDKMKELIRGMLNTLKDMGAEYGMSMEISDEGAAGGEEMAPPEGEAPPPPEAGAEDEAMMEEKLDEMVEKLTKRVAARLVKEAKKKH